MTTTLITGGAGFIGCNLASKLLAKGNKVIIVDNLCDYYSVQLKKDRFESIKDQVKFYEISIEDCEAMTKVFEENKIDEICNFAAQAGVRYSLENPYAYGESNYMGVLNIFELCHKFGVKNIVHASSSSVYGLNEKMPFKETDEVLTPVSVYAATKRANELLAFSYNHLYGLNISCMRFFTVYGPWGRPDMALFKFTKNIINDEPIDVYNNGEMMRDFTYVDDIVNGFMLALEKVKGFEIYNIGCGNPVKLMDFIKEIEESIGKKAKLNMMPMQPGDVKATYADISKAKEKLGYESTTDVKEGVKNFVEWYKEYNKVE